MRLHQKFTQKLNYLYGRITHQTDDDLDAVEELDKAFLLMAKGMLLYAVIAIVLLVVLCYEAFTKHLFR